MPPLFLTLSVIPDGPKDQTRNLEISPMCNLPTSEVRAFRPGMTRLSKIWPRPPMLCHTEAAPGLMALSPFPSARITLISPEISFPPCVRSFILRRFSARTHCLVCVPRRRPRPQHPNPSASRSRCSECRGWCQRPAFIVRPPSLNLGWRAAGSRAQMPGVPVTSETIRKVGVDLGHPPKEVGAGPGASTAPVFTARAGPGSLPSITPAAHAARNGPAGPRGRWQCAGRRPPNNSDRPCSRLSRCRARPG